MKKHGSVGKAQHETMAATKTARTNSNHNTHYLATKPIFKMQFTHILRSRFLAAFFAFSLMVIVGCDSKSTTTANPETDQDREIGTVTLSIQFGEADQNDLSISVPCLVDSTVYSVMDHAKKMRNLNFKSSGSGDRLFVKSIGSADNGLVKNEGAGGSNWIYRVNGVTGDKSAGLYKVKPSDEITWSFGTPPKELTE